MDPAKRGVQQLDRFLFPFVMFFFPLLVYREYLSLLEVFSIFSSGAIAQMEEQDAMPRLSSLGFFRPGLWDQGVFPHFCDTFGVFPLYMGG